MKIFALLIASGLMGLTGWFWRSQEQEVPPAQDEMRVGEATNVDVLFYHLDLAVSVDSQYIQGQVLCRFKALVATNTVTLDLADGLRVTKVDGSMGFQHKNGKLIVNFPKSIQTGEQYEVKVHYQGRPPKATDGVVTKGMVWEKHGKNKNEPVVVTLSTPFLAHFWYPCKDGPSDKADSVYVDITVKDTLINNIPLRGVSNGLCVDSIIGGGKRTYKWRHRYPVVPFYVLVAVSNYQRVVTAYNDDLGNNFPLEYFVFEESMKDAEVMIRRMPEIMDFMTSIFGPYPFRKEKYGMTQMGFYSGIETQTNAIVRDMKGTSIPTAVHELAHQWYGNCVTVSDWRDAWVHEGMASYSEALWQEYKRTFTEYQGVMRKNLWLEGGTLYREEIKDPFSVFKPIVYQKGATMIHMLRHVMGDKYFYDLIKKIPNDPRFRYKSLNSEDVMALAEKSYGDDLEYFFREWLYGEYYPVYHYNWRYDEERKKLLLTLEQEKRETTPNYFIMPIDVKIWLGPKDSIVVSVFNDKPQQLFELDAATLPTAVQLDPENWVLKEVLYSRNILNTKAPLELNSHKTDDLSRKWTFKMDCKKTQDVVFELLAPDGSVVLAETVSKQLDLFEKTLSFPDDKVKNGTYTVRIKGKSDVYFFTAKIL